MTEVTYSANDKNPILDVNVKSKAKTIFEGSGHSVTSKNERGAFDILPFHTNFVTLIADYIIIDKGLKTEKSFKIERGVLYVLSNKVDIYVGI